jgi:hypothetical protein
MRSMTNEFTRAILTHKLLKPDRGRKIHTAQQPSPDWTTVIFPLICNFTRSVSGKSSTAPLGRTERSSVCACTSFFCALSHRQPLASGYCPQSPPIDLRRFLDPVLDNLHFRQYETPETLRSCLRPNQVPQSSPSRAYLYNGKPKSPWLWSELVRHHLLSKSAGHHRETANDQ